MVYITGDCHAEWSKFSSSRFKEGKNLSSNDYVIVCGDFGIWHDNAEERYKLNWLSSKPYNILFVDGNHENFDRLYTEFDVVDFHGGKAHRIRDNIYHLIRGNIYNLCGRTFFAFGGASSHDIQDGILDRNNFNSEREFRDTIKSWWIHGKMFRVNHESWWEEEMPNDAEMDFGLRNLNNHDNKVDYIISHCAPTSIMASISYGTYEADRLTNYLEHINNNVRFKKWFFGHYHFDSILDDRHSVFYDGITRII